MRLPEAKYKLEELDIKPKNYFLVTAHRMLEKEKDWINPFGDGKAAQKIVKEM